MASSTNTAAPLEFLPARSGLYEASRCSLLRYDGALSGVVRCAVDPFRTRTAETVRWHPTPKSDPVTCGSASIVILFGGKLSPDALVTKPHSDRFIWIPREIWLRYEALGGPLGRLGSPAVEMKQTAAGARQDFEHGYIRTFEGGTKTDIEDTGGQEPIPGVGLRSCLDLSATAGPSTTQ